MDILEYIKHLLIRGRVVFTLKAEEEMYLDALTDDDVIESVINARSIHKTLRSTSRFRRAARERLYIVIGRTYDGITIYTKGTIRRQGRQDVFYVFVSAKRAIRGA